MTSRDYCKSITSTETETKMSKRFTSRPYLTVKTLSRFGVEREVTTTVWVGTSRTEIPTRLVKQKTLLSETTIL